MGHWYVEMKIQASNSQVNHGTMKLTASLGRAQRDHYVRRVMLAGTRP